MVAAGHWCGAPPARSAPRWVVGLAAALALSVMSSQALAEPAPSAAPSAPQELPDPPAPEGELPAPPPRPAGAVAPVPEGLARQRPVAPEPLRAEPYAPPPEPYVPPPEPYAPPETDRHPSRWYGWQTIATDAAAVGLVTAGIVWVASAPIGDDGPSVTLMGASYVTYVLGAPIMHFARGHSKKGLGDMALRVFAPPLLGVIGVGFCTSACTGNGGGEIDTRVVLGFVFGSLVGFVGVSILDAAVLAYEPPAGRTAHATPRPPKLTLSWAPDVVVRRDHTVLVGARGVF